MSAASDQNDEKNEFVAWDDEIFECKSDEMDSFNKVCCHMLYDKKYSKPYLLMIILKDKESMLKAEMKINLKKILRNIAKQAPTWIITDYESKTSFLKDLSKEYSVSNCEDFLKIIWMHELRNSKRSEEFEEHLTKKIVKDVPMEFANLYAVDMPNEKTEFNQYFQNIKIFSIGRLIIYDQKPTDSNNNSENQKENKRQQIFFSEISNKNNLHEIDQKKRFKKAIIESIFKNKNIQGYLRLKLAMLFNRADVIKEIISKNSKISEEFEEYLTNKIVKDVLSIWNQIDDSKKIDDAQKKEKILKIFKTFYENSEKSKATDDIVEKILSLFKETMPNNNNGENTIEGENRKRVLEKIKTLNLFDEIKKLFEKVEKDKSNKCEILIDLNKNVDEEISNKCEILIDLYKNGLCENVNINQIAQKINKYSNGCIQNIYNNLFEQNNCCLNDAEEHYKNKHKCNNTCCCLKALICKGQNNEIKSMGESNASKDKLITKQDLFLCSLITDKMDIAKLVWRHSSDHIGSALIGSIICRSMYYKARQMKEVEIMNKFDNYSIEFEDAAKEILSEAYKRDPIRAHLLLVRKLPKWEDETCLKLATKSKLINFLSETAVHTKMNAIWLGRIPPTTSLSTIILNIPLGLLYLIIVIGAYLSNILIFANRIVKKQSKSRTLNQMSSKNSKNKTQVATKLDFKRFKRLMELKKKHEMAIKGVPFYKAVKYTYNSPVTKFIMNLVSYVAFLTCFSYVLLVELNTISQSPTANDRKVEYVVYVFYLSFIFEEFRQFIMDDSRQNNNFKNKMNNWKDSKWNIFDLITYVLFGISFILRQTVNDNDFVYCRSMFAVTLSFFYFRFMGFYYAQRTVGPKIIMIGHMLKDISFFLAIYLIVLFAYGTFALALLYPNRSPNDPLLKNIIYNPYWQLFGQIDLKYMEGTQENGAVATPNALVIVANALFLLFTNILLTNILIAMFGETFKKYEAKSNRVWATLRFRIIEEFYYKPILPPPFSIFESVIYILIRLINPASLSKKHKFELALSEDEQEECEDFEELCMKACLRKNKLFPKSNSEPINISKDYFKSVESEINQNS